MGLASADWSVTTESGITRYLEEIRPFPMLEPQDEFMLAKRWREHGDREAAHKLVTSHLRLVAKIARGYRGYGLPISEVIAEGNVGLMQAVKRFEPDKGFRLATYAMWWIKAAIQEYILRSWSLVKMGTTANQKKLFFNLRKAKSKISALGDLCPDQVKLIAKRLGVTEQDVVDMNRRLGGDVSLNSPIRQDGDCGAWQDWLVDEVSDQETRLVESEESDNRRKALGEALSVLNERERRIFETRRLADDTITLEDLAAEFGVSRERVRQIEVRALEKVQRAVKNRVAVMRASLAGNYAEAVVLDLMQPLAAGRQLIGFGWEARRNEADRKGTRTGKHDAGINRRRWLRLEGPRGYGLACRRVAVRRRARYAAGGGGGGFGGLGGGGFGGFGGSMGTPFNYSITSSARC
jgi:RNA polymerase sigma-32 factor